MTNRITNKEKIAEIIEFCKRRWYETDYDYCYRVRKMPREYISRLAQLMLSHYSEEYLLLLIRYIRQEEIRRLACNVIVGYSQKETTNANDIKFPIRFAKKYRYGRWRTKSIDHESREALFDSWCGN